MTTKKGLGRGLDVLMPESDRSPGITAISLNEIDTNPSQPRRKFDQEKLELLAENIRQSGILQPLLVIPANGRYQIVAGERRYRAARIAGLNTVPCIVRELSLQEQLEAALIENLQREDLNPIEEAAGIRELMEKCGYTQEQAAKRIGRSRPATANLLRLLNLPEDIKKMILDNRLSAGHARVLAGMDDADSQRILARRIDREKLSVREAERIASRTDQKNVRTSVRILSPELEDMRTRLQNVIGVRTMITGGMKRGKVILQYSNEDELESIYLAMEQLEKK